MARYSTEELLDSYIHESIKVGHRLNTVEINQCEALPTASAFFIKRFSGIQDLHSQAESISRIFRNLPDSPSKISCDFMVSNFIDACLKEGRILKKSEVNVENCGFSNSTIYRKFEYYDDFLELCESKSQKFKELLNLQISRFLPTKTMIEDFVKICIKDQNIPRSDHIKTAKYGFSSRTIYRNFESYSSFLAECAAISSEFADLLGDNKFGLFVSSKFMIENFVKICVKEGIIPRSYQIRASHYGFSYSTINRTFEKYSNFLSECAKSNDKFAQILSNTVLGKGNYARTSA